MLGESLCILPSYECNECMEWKSKQILSPAFYDFIRVPTAPVFNYAHTSYWKLCTNDIHYIIGIIFLT